MTDETLRAKAIATLRSVQGEGDYECSHQVADGALCDLLTALGYWDVVEEWRKVGKWYA